MIVTETTVQLSIEDLAALLTQFTISSVMPNKYRGAETDIEKQAAELARKLFCETIRNKGLMEEMIKMGKK